MVFAIALLYIFKKEYEIFLNKRWKIDKEYNINKILYLLIDRPDKINEIGNVIWNSRNYNFPAVVLKNGHVAWTRHDTVYRIIHNYETSNKK